MEEDEGSLTAENVEMAEMETLQLSSPYRSWLLEVEDMEELCFCWPFAFTAAK